MTGDTNSLYPSDQEFACIPMALATTVSGMEIFNKMLADELPPPPIYRQANIKLVQASDGYAKLRAVPLESHYNPIGTVHGGWIATLLDSALASCVHTKVPRGKGFSTIEFKSNILRPVTVKSGPLICEGTVLYLGQSIATSEARVFREDGKMVAHGVETCAIFDIPVS